MFRRKNNFVPEELISRMSQKISNEKYTICEHDGITAEMLKCGGDAVIKWMVKICHVAWDKGVGGWRQQIGQKPSLFQFTKGRAGEGTVGAIEV